MAVVACKITSARNRLNIFFFTLYSSRGMGRKHSRYKFLGQNQRHTVLKSSSISSLVDSNGKFVTNTVCLSRDNLYWKEKNSTLIYIRTSGIMRKKIIAATVLIITILCDNNECMRQLTVFSVSRNTQVEKRPHVWKNKFSVPLLFLPF